MKSFQFSVLRSIGRAEESYCVHRTTRKLHILRVNWLGYKLRNTHIYIFIYTYIFNTVFKQIINVCQRNYKPQEWNNSENVSRHHM